MLVIASARLNIEQAVIYQTCENTNRCSHLIPQEGCLSMWDLKEGCFHGYLIINTIRWAWNR